MIKKIVHLADLHIRKTPTRNEEYEKVFKALIESLDNEKPDRIVIVGDLVHDYLDLQGEQLILAHEFLNTLASIAPVRITRGNHDCRKKNLKRVDSIKAIVRTLNHPDIAYYDKTGLYPDDNIIWAVWHHGDPKNNPWKTKHGKEILANEQRNVTIDLFHDPINGCKSTTGFEMKSKAYYKVSEFKGDMSMFGDIHRMQILDKKGTKAYCGSLIAQDFSEGDDNFHGYLLWDTETKIFEEVEISNPYSFKNIKISPYTDFNDLDFEIENPTSIMRVRFKWNVLPNTRTKENERKVIAYIKSKYPNATFLMFAHKNEFIEADKVDVNENVTLENINNSAVQHEIFREYLTKIGVNENVINDVIALDDEISANITIDEIYNIQWDIIKFGGENFASYEKLDIDWRGMDGLFQITGINTAGKSTIMKLMSYILYNKSLETDYRQKFGDARFINNRNNATFCDTYMVLEVNGEYFGIKRRTEITKNKGGEITGAPTTLNYHVLGSPDDEMNEANIIDNLNEDQRKKTQKTLNAVIGNYDNFIRVVLTTSDTLNRILSNDMATFIDSLLFDSGLDIFDKKMEGLKIHQKAVNEKGRLAVDTIKLASQNDTLTQENITTQNEITVFETVTLPDIQNRISTGRTYVEDLTKKLFKIDPEIVNLDVVDTQKNIDIYKNNIVAHNARKGVLEKSIKPLKETYDSEKLTELTKKRDTHKTEEYNRKLDIKSHEQTIRDNEHQLEIINGEILRLKQDGAKLKKEIGDTKNSKICDKCGQEINKPEHIQHIAKVVKEKETEMFAIADKIKNKETAKKPYQDAVDENNKEIEKIKKQSEDATLAMESVLKEIGDLTNDKNDVEKRKEFQTELDQIPTKIQNEELKIQIEQTKIDNRNNVLLQIKENEKTEKGITAAKERIKTLEGEESDTKEDILLKKSTIAENAVKIKTNTDSIRAFEEQEYRDSVINLYKKCVHRDGIPKQILSNYIIPKINQALDNILSVAQFKVWLDAEDLRPKLVYNSRPTAIVDCIGASGKERTFASVVLKFALNQINVKAKPTTFLLDEVMGKLNDESVEEFVEILHIIKNHMKKVLIIEHDKEVNPDYLINVQVDESGISSLVIE